MHKIIIIVFTFSLLLAIDAPIKLGTQPENFSLSKENIFDKVENVATNKSSVTPNNNRPKRTIAPLYEKSIQTKTNDSTTNNELTNFLFIVKNLEIAQKELSSSNDNNSNVLKILYNKNELYTHLGYFIVGIGLIITLISIILLTFYLRLTHKVKILISNNDNHFFKETDSQDTRGTTQLPATDTPFFYIDDSNVDGLVSIIKKWENQVLYNLSTKAEYLNKLSILLHYLPATLRVKVTDSINRKELLEYLASSPSIEYTLLEKVNKALMEELHPSFNCTNVLAAVWTELSEKEKEEYLSTLNDKMKDSFYKLINPL